MKQLSEVVALVVLGLVLVLKLKVVELESQGGGLRLLHFDMMLLHLVVS